MKATSRIAAATALIGFASPWSARSDGGEAADLVWSESISDASPQESTSAPSLRPYGYGFYAGGSCNHDFRFSGGGGGGEVFPWKRLGLGFDGGYYKFHEDTEFGLASFHVALHLVDPSSGSRVDPFLSVSPGFYWSEDQAGGALGVGGGLNFWLMNRVGIRGEMRLQALGTEEGLTVFRIGATFR
jgi:hypothetical protein